MSAHVMSAQAPVHEAHVKVAAAAGRSRNKVHAAMGVPLLAADKAAGQ